MGSEMCIRDRTAAFFSEKDEVVNDDYKLKDKEFISIIPPIGGG